MEARLVWRLHLHCLDQGAAMMQLKQEVGELTQAGRRDKRQVQKLQLELLQARQLLEKLRGDLQVPRHSVMARQATNTA